MIHAMLNSLYKHQLEHNIKESLLKNPLNIEPEGAKREAPNRVWPLRRRHTKYYIQFIVHKLIALNYFKWKYI